MKVWKRGAERLRPGAVGEVGQLQDEGDQQIGGMIRWRSSVRVPIGKILCKLQRLRNDERLDERKVRITRFRCDSAGAAGPEFLIERHDPIGHDAAERLRIVLEGRRHLGQQVIEAIFISSEPFSAADAESHLRDLVRDVVVLREQKNR